MAKNPYGRKSHGNVEWGSKARKEETALRGLNHSADREAIEEQMEWFDYEPNPYHGTYSEE